MKKNKNVIHQLSREKYQLKRRQWNNGNRKRKGSSYLFPKENNSHFIERKAPKIFNLKPEHAEDVIEYINTLKKLGSTKKGLFLNLSEVEEIGIGAISMLLSVMSELNDNGTVFRGLKPRHEESKDILERSGFMKFVNGSVKVENKNTRNTIFTGNKRTNHTEILDAIHSSMETVWGVSGRSPLLYGTIVEMIKNSCKHAFKSENNVWWHFAVSHDEDKKIVRFSFVDNGIGVVGSYKKGELFKQIVGLFKSNSEFIESAFTKGIESKTGLKWRGTGLPTIYESFEDNIIKNFVVITNDAYCNFNTKRKTNLKNEFNGTYYYWEIDEMCVKHCF